MIELTKTPPVSLEMIQAAGFVPLMTPSGSYFDQRKNHRVVMLFHQTVFDLPPHEQLDQPWIEFGQWAARLEKPDYTEGRYGAMRYPFRCLNDLHLFMRNFDYTYVTVSPELLLLL